MFRLLPKALFLVFLVLVSCKKKDPITSAASPIGFINIELGPRNFYYSDESIEFNYSYLSNESLEKVVFLWNDSIVGSRAFAKGSFTLNLFRLTAKDTNNAIGLWGISVTGDTVRTEEVLWIKPYIQRFTGTYEGSYFTDYRWSFIDSVSGNSVLVVDTMRYPAKATISLRDSGSLWIERSVNDTISRTHIGTNISQWGTFKGSTDRRGESLEDGKYLAWDHSYDPNGNTYRGWVYEMKKVK